MKVYQKNRSWTVGPTDCGEIYKSLHANKREVAISLEHKDTLFALESVR